MKVDQEKLESIRQKHDLSLILLHGSQVDGRVHEKSDIDIAVVKKSDNKKYALLELISDLADALNSDKIDLCDLTHADPLLLYSSTKKSELLSGKESDYDSLQRKAFHKYSDYLPYLKKEAEFVKERIKSYVTTR